MVVLCVNSSEENDEKYSRMKVELFRRQIKSSIKTLFFYNVGCDFEADQTIDGC